MKQFWSIWKLNDGKLPSKVDIYRNPLQKMLRTYKYCDNTCNYYTCRWTNISSIGSILVSIITKHTSIVTQLVSIDQVNTPFDNLLMISRKIWGRIKFKFPQCVTSRKIQMEGQLKKLCILILLCKREPWKGLKMDVAKIRKFAKRELLREIAYHLKNSVEIPISYIFREINNGFILRFFK